MRLSLLGLLLAVAAGAWATVEHRERAAELEAERQKSARYAAAIVACANGNDFFIGEHRVQCRSRRKQ